MRTEESYCDVGGRGSAAGAGAPGAALPVASMLLGVSSKATINDVTMWHTKRLFETPRFFTRASIEASSQGAWKILNVVAHYPSSQRRRKRQLPRGRVPPPETPLSLTPSSEVWFLHSKYRCVFSLDFTRSMLAHHGRALPADAMVDALCKCLRGLSCIDIETDVRPPPMVYVSVVAVCAELGEVWSLLQGWQLEVTEMEHMLARLRRDILAAESRLRARLREEEGERDGTQLEFIAQASAFALKFLPFDAAPMVVVLSDCVLGRPPAVGYDSLIMQFSRYAIPVHGVLVGTSRAAMSDEWHAFGYEPDEDGLMHVCAVTGGTSFDMDLLASALELTTNWGGDSGEGGVMHAHPHQSLMDSVGSRLTPFQKLLLYRPSPVNIRSAASLMQPLSPLSKAPAGMPHAPIDGALVVTSGLASPGVWQEQVRAYTLPRVSMERIMEMRCSEGFRVFDMRLGHHELANSTSPLSHIQHRVRVQFSLLWQARIRLDYILDFEGSGMGSASVKLEVTASADFLHRFRAAQLQSDQADDSLGAFSGRSSPASLMDFMDTLHKVDMMLYQVCNIQHIPQSLGGIPPDERMDARKYLWLGSLSTMDWHRWFVVEYFEVLYKDDLSSGAFAELEVPTMPGGTGLTKRELLAATCLAWSTLELAPGLFLKVLPALGSNRGAASPPLFALLKVVWEAPNLAVLHLGCFAMLSITRRNLLADLTRHIWGHGGHVAGRKDSFSLPVAASESVPSEPGSVALPPLLHKINTGLSGLESTISFQLALPFSQDRSRSSREQPASSSGRWIQNASPSHLVLSYLKRWTWHWTFSSPVLQPDLIVKALANARQMDGFIDITMSEKSALLVKGVKVLHHRSADSPADGCLRVLLQYCLYWSSDDTIVTELLMEPQHGFVQKQKGSGGIDADEDGFVDDSELATGLTQYLYGSDFTALASFNTYGAVNLGCLSQACPYYVLSPAGLASTRGQNRFERRIKLPLSLNRLLAHADIDEVSLQMFHNTLSSVAQGGPRLCHTCKQHRAVKVGVSGGRPKPGADVLDDIASMKVYKMLESALAALNTIDLPWALQLHEGETAVMPVLPMPFGSLPQDYVSEGRWYARILEGGAKRGLLLTFLPSYDMWLSLRHLNDPRISGRETGGEGRRISLSPTRDEVGVNRHAIRRGNERARKERSASHGGEPFSMQSRKGQSCPPLGIFLFQVDEDSLGRKRVMPLGRLDVYRSILCADIPVQYRVAHAAGRSSRHRISHQADPVDRPVLSSSALDPLTYLREQYCYDIKRLHRMASARAAYLALRAGAALCYADIDRSLQECEEVAMGLDVTLLRAIKMAATSSPEADSCDDEFSTLVSTYFRPIPGTDYYIWIKSRVPEFEAHAMKEPPEPPDQHSQGELYGDEELQAPRPDLIGGKENWSSVNIAPGAESADHSSCFAVSPPLFVRFELRQTPPPESASRDPVVRRLGHGISFTHALLEGGGLLMPVESWLAHQSSRLEGKSGAPLFGGSDPSASRTIIYVIMTTFGTADSAATPMEGAARSKGHRLRSELATTFLEHIDAFASAEILRSLMSVTPVTMPAMLLVRRCLRPLPPKEVTRFQVPVELVLDTTQGAEAQMAFSAKARELLEEQLLKLPSLSLRRVGEYFFVVEEEGCMGEGVSALTGEVPYRIPYWAIIRLDAKGAGEVSLSGNSSPVPGDTRTVQQLDTSEIVRPTLQLRADVDGLGCCTSVLPVMVSIHHPTGSPLQQPGAISKLSDALRLGVETAAGTANRMLLLDSLHETKISSSLLIAPEPGSALPVLAADNFPGSSKSPLDWRMPYPPGHFACPLQYQKRFELYHRLQASVLGTLETAALHAFAISNRLHCYVYRDMQGAVFHMSLEEVKTVMDEEGPKMEVVSTPQQLTPSSSSSSQSPASDAAAVAGLASPKCVVLSVYGVSNVGPGITVHLTRLLDQKLKELSLGVLSGLLARNPKFQLTDTDICLIKASGNSGRPWGMNSPTSHLPDASANSDTQANLISRTSLCTGVLMLPSALQDFPLYLTLLQQILCAGELVHMLHAVRPESIADLHAQDGIPCDLSAGRGTADSPGRGDEPTRLDPMHLTFHYNLSQQMPSSMLKLPHARRIGRGLGFISLSPLNKSGAVQWSFSSDASNHVQKDGGQVLPSNAELFRHLYEVEESELDRATPHEVHFEVGGPHGDLPRVRARDKYGILLQLHTCGAIDVPHLVQLIEQCCNQALIDYHIERILLLDRLRDHCSNVDQVPRRASVLPTLFTSPPESAMHSVSDKSLSARFISPSGQITTSPRGLHALFSSPVRGRERETRAASFSSRGSPRDREHVFLSSISSPSRASPVRLPGRESNCGPQLLPASAARTCRSIGKLLQSAASSGSPTACQMRSQESFPSWCMRPALQELLCTLRNFHPAVVNLVTIIKILRVPGADSPMSVALTGLGDGIGDNGVLYDEMDHANNDAVVSYIVTLGVSLSPTAKVHVRESGVRYPVSSSQSLPAAAEHMRFSSGAVNTFHGASSHSLMTMASAAGNAEPELTLFPSATFTSAAELLGERDGSGNLKVDDSEANATPFTLSAKHRGFFIAVHISCGSQMLEMYNAHPSLMQACIDAYSGILSHAKVHCGALESLMYQKAGLFAGAWARRCAMISGSDLASVGRSASSKWGKRGGKEVILSQEVISGLVGDVDSSDEKNGLSRSSVTGMKGLMPPPGPVTNQGPSSSFPSASTDKSTSNMVKGGGAFAALRAARKRARGGLGAGGRGGALIRTTSASSSVAPDAATEPADPVLPSAALATSTAGLPTVRTPRPSICAVPSVQWRVHIQAALSGLPQEWERAPTPLQHHGREIQSLLAAHGQSSAAKADVNAALTEAASSWSWEHFQQVKWGHSQSDMMALSASMALSLSRTARLVSIAVCPIPANVLPSPPQGTAPAPTEFNSTDSTQPGGVPETVQDDEGGHQEGNRSRSLTGHNTALRRSSLPLIPGVESGNTLDLRALARQFTAPNAPPSGSPLGGSIPHRAYNSARSTRSLSPLSLPRQCAPRETPSRLFLRSLVEELTAPRGQFHKLAFADYAFDGIEGGFGSCARPGCSLLDRAVLFSPLFLSQSMMLMDIQVVLRTGKGTERSLGVEELSICPLLAICRLFAVDLPSRADSNRQPALDSCGTFEWRMNGSLLQIPHEISTFKSSLLLQRVVVDFLLGEVWERMHCCRQSIFEDRLSANVIEQLQSVLRMLSTAPQVNGDERLCSACGQLFSLVGRCIIVPSPGQTSFCSDLHANVEGFLAYTVAHADRYHLQRWDASGAQLLAGAVGAMEEGQSAERACIFIVTSPDGEEPIEFGEGLPIMVYFIIKSSDRAADSTIDSDIADSCSKLLLTSLSQAMVHYQRELIWQRLGQAMLEGGTKMDLDDDVAGTNFISVAELRVLLEFSALTPLEVWDSRLRTLFETDLGIPWQDWLQHLHSKPSVSTVHCNSLDETGRETLLCILAHLPGHSPGLLILITLGEADGTAQRSTTHKWERVFVSMVRRFDSDTLNGRQREAVSAFVNDTVVWAAMSTFGT